MKYGLLWAACLLLTASPIAARAQSKEKDAKTATPASAPAATTAPAAEKGAAASFTPPKAGPETNALKPFVVSSTWTGVSKAGAMGPGSPEMPTKGKSNCKWTLNNLWAMCDLDETVGTGKQAMNWKAHWMIGWDFEAKEYRSLLVDSYGLSTAWKGKIDGSKLIVESVENTTMMGQPCKMRLTWDAADPKAVKFMIERSIKGSPMMVTDEATYKASGK